jgi:site-specific DNA recombinase
MSPRPATVRCAIYTRKSSEEGLDQAFNSLDAQRESCEAYVLSQAGEGWKALPTLYDDGGYSGGNIERPALKRLLDDITAGRVDTVVVYKIDRLTRSLADFAKIVERLDAANASFVSVTQAFNTTTSMGRLTLNVLLSFAQFEREVTGERIRDKIAASKAKGMWMGGRLPLGYDRPTDPTTRALVINPTEAAIVRQIFERYLALRSVRQLAEELEAGGVRSKVQLTAKGGSTGGCVLQRGALFHLLGNRTYLGEIPHKDQFYPGRHPAIVEPEVFEAAQKLLTGNAQQHRDRPTKSAEAALKGLLFDADGHPMTPTWGVGKCGRSYRYYISNPLLHGRALGADDGAIRRLSAEGVEDLVLQRLQRWARPKADAGWTWAKSAVSRIDVHPNAVHILLDRAATNCGSPQGDADLARLSSRLEAGEAIDPSHADPKTVRILLLIRLKLRGGRSWLISPDGKDAVVRTRIDKSLIKGLRLAHRLAAANSLTDGVGAKAPARPYDRKLCLLAFLAPDIQEAILEGRQPASLNLERLVHEPFPLAWADQRTALGF